MKAFLKATAVWAAVLAATSPRAFGQVRWDGAPLEGHFHHDTTLIDDVQRESRPKAPTGRLWPALGDPRPPHPALDDIRARQRLSLIDDVDREAQRRTAEERIARGRTVGRPDNGPVGRYTVATSDKHTILVDTITGRTWMLSSSATARPAGVVWLPIKRIDEDDNASQRRANEEERRSQRDARDVKRTP